MDSQMIENKRLAEHSPLSDAARSTLIILTAFVLFFVVWYFHLGIGPFKSLIGNSQSAYYLTNYLISGLIPAVAMWLLYRRRNTVQPKTGTKIKAETGTEPKAEIITEAQAKTKSTIEIGRNAGAEIGTNPETVSTAETKTATPPHPAHTFSTILAQLGLAHGFGIGMGFAVLCTLPMCIGYAAIGTYDTEVSADHLLTRIVIAGFFEELIFRGFVFGQLFRCARWGFLPAALLTAVAFGSLHLYQGHDWISALSAFGVTALGSLFFSWLFVEWNYNLWTVVWLHTLMNLPWIVFRVSDTGAVGDIWDNVLRISTIVLAVGLTVWHKQKRGLPYFITFKSLIINHE